MAEITSAHEPEPVELELPFSVSAEFRATYTRNTGQRLAHEHVFACSLEELPETLRPLGLDIENKRSQLEIDDLRPEVPDIDLADPIANAQQVLTAWKDALIALEATLTTKRAEQQQREQTEQAQAETFRGEMADWVEAHGSPRLRLAVARNYRVTGAYVRERAEEEFPGFTVDVEDEAAWRIRSNPSEMALAMETETIERLEELSLDLEPRIVWMTTPPRALARKYDYEAAEAIAVRNWLGRYDLVRLVEPDRQPAFDPEIPF